MKRIVSLWFLQAVDDRLARSGQKDWRLGQPSTIVWLDSCRATRAVTRMPAPRPRYLHAAADARTLVPDLVTTAVEPQADRRLIESLGQLVRPLHAVGGDRSPGRGDSPKKAKWRYVCVQLPRLRRAMPGC